MFIFALFELFYFWQILKLIFFNPKFWSWFFSIPSFEVESLSHECYQPLFYCHTWSFFLFPLFVWSAKVYDISFFCCFALIIVQICQNHYESESDICSTWWKVDFLLTLRLEPSLSSAKEKGIQKSREEMFDKIISAQILLISSVCTKYQKILKLDSHFTSLLSFLYPFRLFLTFLQTKLTCPIPFQFSLVLYQFPFWKDQFSH